ncbi:MAG: LptE family protein [Syntrophaceae bacterium]|nr:LptE family protein [Syntrophaceae bacterium]
MQKNLPCPPLIKGEVRTLIGIACILILFFISGCGYRFSSGGEYIDKKIRTVFIDNFANRTGETYIDNTIRNAFINQFTTGRRFTIVDRREKADAIFRGSIDSLTTAPLSYQKSNLAAEERVTITMELAFEEQDTKKSIWTNKSFSGYQDYATPDLNSKEANRKNALIKLSNDTAERAYRLMMSGF